VIPHLPPSIAAATHIDRLAKEQTNDKVKLAMTILTGIAVGAFVVKTVKELFAAHPDYHRHLAPGVEQARGR
jgi:hypothetical protein